LRVWTAASGEQVWNEPEYVVHAERGLDGRMLTGNEQKP
jgi:hypothetical protein